MKKRDLKTVGRPLKYPAGFKVIGRALLYITDIIDIIEIKLSSG